MVSNTMACIWCVLNARSCVGCVRNAHGYVRCVHRPEATALAPESSVYILYAVYLGANGMKNIFFVLFIFGGAGIFGLLFPNTILSSWLRFSTIGVHLVPLLSLLLPSSSISVSSSDPGSELSPESLFE